MTRNAKIAIVGVVACLACLAGSSVLAQPKDPMPPRPPTAMGPGMHGAPQMPGRFDIEHAERIERMLDLVARMKRTAFDPAEAGLIAIGGLKDEFRRKGDEVIQDLETQLDKTKSLGLRNALRLGLKDLYKAQGEDGKALDQLRAMLAENDEALQKRPDFARPRPGQLPAVRGSEAGEEN